MADLKTGVTISVDGIGKPFLLATECVHIAGLEEKMLRIFINSALKKGIKIELMSSYTELDKAIKINQYSIKVNE